MPARVAALGFLALAVVASLVAGGCAEPTYRQCFVNSDCKPGTYCRGTSCSFDCRVDIDCGPTGRCDTRLGLCTNTGVPDAGSSDGNNPIVDGGKPADLTGAPPPDFTMTSPPPDLSMTTPTPDFTMTSPQPDLIVAGNRPYGDVCSVNTECASTVCSSNPFASSDKECTGPCGGCMVGDFCVGNLTCAQSDIGKKCILTNNGADCRGGACLGVANLPQTAFCTRVCNSSADCPAGYGCSVVQSTKVCINVEATGQCLGNADCWYGTLCDVARRRCLATCTSNLDCPLFHNCVLLGSNPVCAPTAAQGGGGIDAPCASGNDCRQGACLMNRCLAACSVTVSDGQWCPGGYGCNPVSDGAGGYILGCLNAGLGAPGSPCVDNSSCASGVCIDSPGYCSRFCNSAPCPSPTPNCVPLGIVADGVALDVCSK